MIYHFAIIADYLTITDKDYSDGLNRYTFVKGVKYVISERLRWPDSIGDLMVQQYTTWDNVADRIENRENYIQVILVI